MSVVLNKKKQDRKRGFTLIEIMVSVSIFVVIMVISMGTIVTIVDANRKSQNLRTVMDNLNFTIEAMTRTIRFATNYHCDMNLETNLTTRDCFTVAKPPSDSMYVDRAQDGVKVYYYLSGGRIARRIGAGAEYFLTSSDVTITSLKFRVIGSTPYSNGQDTSQPMVIITIAGNAGTKATSRSSFTMQTTVSQRVFDSQ